MKRFNKTAVALATAGAMTLGVVPVAVANDDDQATTVEGFIPSDDPNAYPANPEELKPEDVWAETIAEGEGVIPSDDPNAYPANPEELKPEDVFAEKDPNIPPAQTIPNPANPDEECYLHNSGEFYVFDSNDWNTPADQIDDKCKVFVDAEQDPADDEGPAGDEDPAEEKDANKVLRALAGLAGVGAVIYLLGQAYKAVTSSSGSPVLVPVERADQAPTAEDEAATDQLVADHGEEIVAQAAEAGVADNGAAADNDADADRGVSAATGNNNIAQGLIGLLLASILGAAAFVFGRRQLV